MRVCSAALRAELPGFLARMADAGVQAADSRLLPGEFVRVSGGLQQLLARTVVTGADCQVRVQLPFTGKAAGNVVACSMRLPVVSHAQMSGVSASKRGALKVVDCAACGLTPRNKGACALGCRCRTRRRGWWWRCWTRSRARASWMPAQRRAERRCSLRPVWARCRCARLALQTLCRDAHLIVVPALSSHQVLLPCTEACAYSSSLT